MNNTIKIKKKKRSWRDIPHWIRSLLISLVFAFAYFYVMLPAINLHNPSFYVFVFLVSAVYCFVSLVGNKGFTSAQNARDAARVVKNVCLVPAVICIGLVVIYIVGTLLSSVIIRANAYSNLMQVEVGNFAEDVDEISYDQIPMLDKDSAQRLGDRKLGELSDVVSQFEVANDYNQINYNGRPMRIATLEYGNFFKWLKNRSDGIPAYILIDMVTQNVEVVRLEEGIRYSTCEHFSRNLMRHLRFNYPFYMFDTPHMEIDEQGNPWWVCPRMVKSIGLFGGTDISGVVLVNAVTGESAFYESDNIPTWVDQVYSDELLIAQYDYHGMYGNGFLNYFFSQTGVTVTTDGSNFIALDDDVYVYTGITSVGGDESNVGFILSNMRTKQTKYYACAGAEEYSAMSSAEGIVQQMNYRATFPLLLNVSDQPTYFIALKDNAGLVKMYAMVNVQQYNIVATGETVFDCEAQYISQLTTNGIIAEEPPELFEISGIVEDMRSAVIDGNSVYYFKLQGRDGYISISAALCQEAVIINVGDLIHVSLGSSVQEGGIQPATDIWR